LLKSDDISGHLTRRTLYSVVDNNIEGCLSTAEVVNASPPRCYVTRTLPIMLMLVHAGMTPFVICLLYIIFCCLPKVILPYSNILSVPGNCISSGHLDMTFIRTISPVYPTTRRHIAKGCNVLHYDNKMTSERAVEWAANVCIRADVEPPSDSTSDSWVDLDDIVMWKETIIMRY
jgi:hypothetical protein